MGKKKLIIIAFILLILIIIVILALGRTGNTTNKTQMHSSYTEFKSNSQKLIDYDENVVKYGNDVYFLDDLSSSIIKYDMKSKESQIVINFSDKTYSDRFFIRSNKLIFSYDNKTYYSDLNGENVTNFCDGTVIYIDDNSYIYISHDGKKDSLSIVSYNYKNFKTFPNTYYNLAKGRNVEYLKSMDNKVYVTSKNLDETISLLEIDIKNSQLTLVSRLSSENEKAMITKAYSDVIKGDGYYYFIVKEVMHSHFSEQDGACYLYSRNIKDSIEEYMSNNIGYHLAYDPKIRGEILFEEFNNDDVSNAQSEWLYITDRKVSNYSWNELVYGDVTSYFSIKDMNLYSQEGKIANLEIKEGYYNLERVIRLDDGYYFCIDGSNDHTWYRCDENGNNLEKMYEGKNAQ